MPKEKCKHHSGPTRGSTCGRTQRGIEQPPAADVGESSTTASSTAGVNYADLSNEGSPSPPGATKSHAFWFV
jgi:hypothetical protein